MSSELPPIIQSTQAVRSEIARAGKKSLQLKQNTKTFAALGLYWNVWEHNPTTRHSKTQACRTRVVSTFLKSATMHICKTVHACHTLFEGENSIISNVSFWFPVWFNFTKWLWGCMGVLSSCFEQDGFTERKPVHITSYYFFIVMMRINFTQLCSN